METSADEDLIVLLGQPSRLGNLILIVDDFGTTGPEGAVARRKGIYLA